MTSEDDVARQVSANEGTYEPLIAASRKFTLAAWRHGIATHNLGRMMSPRGYG